MQTNIKILSLLLLAATACGDNKLAPDARVRPDTGSGGSGGFPAAPTLGAQIDRMGRPAVNTLLNHGFDPTPAAGSAKDAYNADANYGSGWIAAWRGEFMKNLGVLDALDRGFCGNGLCEQGEKGGLGSNAALGICEADCGSNVLDSGSGNACGNTVLYNAGLGSAGSAANPLSYAGLATLLADDELFLNTSKPACALYLALEYYASQPGGVGLETTCGGRALDYDVVDFSLSMIAAGVGGFDIAAGFVPKIKDGANKHTDYLADFPYLGNPH